MPKKSKVAPKKYREWRFYHDQFSGCCGIGIFCRFQQAPTHDLDYETDWRRPQKKVNDTKFDTMEEVAEDLYQRMIKYAEELSYYTTYQIALVSHYDTGPNAGTHQFQELEDILLREEWVITQVFINPNHGNEITLFTKHFPEWVAKRLGDAEPGDEAENENNEDEDW